MPKDKIVQELQKLVQELGTQKAVAAKLNVSEQYLSDVLRGKTKPGPAFLYALGYEKIERYKEIKP